MLQQFLDLLNTTNSIYVAFFLIMLYWADKRIKLNDKKADERESRLMKKVDSMERRYIEREDKYQKMVNTLTTKVVNKVDKIEYEIKDIKEVMEEKLNKK